MAVTTSGLGSGIDIRQLVDDMIVAEGKSKSSKFDRDEAKVLSKITSYGTLRGVLSDFQSTMENLKSPAKFQGRVAISADESKYTATANAVAAKGSYSVEVTQLAKNHKLSSAAFSNPDEVVGTGSLKFKIGSVEHTFSITSADQTLKGVVKRINETSTTTGISATIVTSDAGSKIMFSSNETGENKVFTVSVVSDEDSNNNDNSGLSRLSSEYLDITQAGSDSTVIIDGSIVTSSSNTVQNAIEGITLTLKETNIAEPKLLTVNLDKNSAINSIQSFISGYNKMIETVNDLKKVGAEGALSASGDLVGDATLRNLEIQIRREISSAVFTVPGGVSTLAEMGITSDRYTGKLIIDNSKLTSILDTQFDNVGTLFAKDETGVAMKLNALFDNYLKSSGVLESKITGLNSSIATIDEKRERLELHLQNLEKRLLSQFIAMDSIVASLKSTSDFLSQQLSSLPDPLAYKK